MIAGRKTPNIWKRSVWRLDLGKQCPGHLSVCLSVYLSIYLIKLELGNRHAGRLASIYPRYQALRNSQEETAKNWAGTK